ncbi:MAG: RluA family pseudouridine synthase [Salinivirgaceae bacterium]|jgi:23S rRNA pseudouridine1911/1915/1917 synthase|nr:RluA family pseudouridine synthase [Salinivirgaceae bacterium]
MSEEQSVFEEEEEENELFEHYRFEVDGGQKPLRIDKYLHNRIENSSRSKIQSAADAGSIRVDERIVKSNYKVKAGEVVTIVLEYPPREIEIIPEDIPLNVEYEDDSFVIINKPPGLVVHPSYGHYTGTLINALAFRYKDLSIFNGADARPGLVHRIDKNTSGLLVIAKNEEAKSKIALQFFEHTTHRRYMALVWGNFEEEEGTITGHVGRSLKNRKVMTVFPEGEFGKHAITHYKVLKRFGYVTLVECRLETGRTHQIRVHMKHIGHPLFNDFEYGGDKILKGTTFTKYKQFIQNCFNIMPRQALHAKELGFNHPKTDEFVKFVSETPGDFQAVLDKWEAYVATRDE